jgi:hypothetical protein
MLMIAWMVLSMAADPSTTMVEVHGTTTCPPPAAVEAALAGLTPAREPVAAADVAELSDDGSQVVVTLRRATGELVAQKRLESNLSCSERARVAAVVIAAWEAKLATPPGSLTLVETTNATAAVAPTTTLVGRPDPARPAPPPAGSIRVEPGVALHASLAGVGVAPAGAVELAFVRSHRSLVPALAVFAVGTHATPISPGEATWSRYGLAAAAAGVAGSWTGYYQGCPGPTGSSDVIKMTLVESSGGSGQIDLVFGTNPPPPPATDATDYYPPGFMVGNSTFRTFEGVSYRAHSVTWQDRRLKFMLAAYQLWDDWCELQSSFPVANSLTGYSCTPGNGGSWSGPPDDECIASDGVRMTPVACAQFFLCGIGACTCDMCGCTGSTNYTDQFDLTFDGDLVTGVGTGCSVRLTRDTP